MDTAIATSTPLDLQPDASNDDLTRAELEAIVDDTLDPADAQLWRLLHGNEAGRTHLSTLVRRVYPAVSTNAECSATAKRIIGKVSARGIPRARAFQLMTGFTPATVAETLTRVMQETEDDKTAVRAADVSARCLGMIAPAGRGDVTVNVGIQVTTSISSVLDRIDGDNE